MFSEIKVLEPGEMERPDSSDNPPPGQNNNHNDGWPRSMLWPPLSMWNLPPACEICLPEAAAPGHDSSHGEGGGEYYRWCPPTPRDKATPRDNKSDLEPPDVNKSATPDDDPSLGTLDTGADTG